MIKSENSLILKLLNRQKRNHLICFFIILLGLLSWLTLPLIADLVLFNLQIILTYIGALVLCVFIIISYLLLNKQFNNKNKLIYYLNNTYPQLEYSLHLLTAESKSINTLQQIQKNKVQSVFEQIYPNIKLQQYLKRALLFLLINVIGVFAISYYIGKTNTNEKNTIPII